MELTETTRVNDGYMWHCTNKRCRTWLSIRSGSFFEGSNIPLSTWLHLMFLWAMQISGSKIVRLTSLSKPTGVVERGSQKVLLFRVHDRTRETLVHRLITTHIRPKICHLLRSIHSVHTCTTQTARIHP